MKRRNFLATLGATAAGSSAVLGTGAFTSVSANRSVGVAVAADSNAFLALEAGDSGLVTGTDDGTLEINLDGSAEGADGSGVNMNAKTAVGHVDTSKGVYNYNEPWEDNYAFTLQNQGTQTLGTVQLKYELEDSDWITGEDVAYNKGNEPISSYIQFIPYRKNTNYPGKVLRAPNDDTGNDRAATEGVYECDAFSDWDADASKFGPGDKLYFSILVDTTRENADVEDKLSGTLTIGASDPI